MTNAELLRKYDTAVPRYTSYPTVPCWDIEKFSSSDYFKAVERCFAESNAEKGISLYIHLPFCESLCTYCACNTRITKNHNVESSYLYTLLGEWRHYRSHFNALPVIREIHLGGGTPTFFSAGNLYELITGLLKNTVIHPKHEFSFEGHPNNTTAEHLKVLYDLGFERVSFGVQDLDPVVQKAINRIQPLANVKRSVEEARAIGYKSINFDLIYGLPYQTQASVANTVSEVIALRPERISFYSYAHVPWIKPGQRGYEDADLPTDVVKRSLYETGRELFLAAGYIDVGMDHFALPCDKLALALHEGKLHRNFMGYTTNETDLLIGLGTSSISDAKYAYAQNAKKVEEYSAAVAAKGHAIFKGHLQTDADLRLKAATLRIVCGGTLELKNLMSDLTEERVQRLAAMSDEGIIHIDKDRLKINEEGRAFIRNVASIFDARLNHKVNDKPLFSRAI